MCSTRHNQFKQQAAGGRAAHVPSAHISSAKGHSACFTCCDLLLHSECLSAKARVLLLISACYCATYTVICSFRWDRKYWATYKVLDILQKVFYRSNPAREAFVEMCEDSYVQKMTFDSYLYKTVVPGG